MKKDAVLHLLNSNERTKQDQKTLQSFFLRFMRKGEVDEELLAELGEEDYRRLETMTRKQYSDYFDLQEFVSSLKEDEAKDILVELYKNPIVSFTPKAFHAAGQKYGKDIYLHAAIALNHISDDAIAKNYSKEGFKGNLIESYDFGESVADALAQVYEDNFQRLAISSMVSLLYYSKEEE